MALTESYVAGPTTPALREITFGDLLLNAAKAAPDRLALIAGVPDPALRRKWTYARLYREAPVNAIREGSGNVVCLDVLRALAREGEPARALLA